MEVQQEEIGKPIAGGDESRMPFGKRLRLALENLDEGKALIIRTKTERQHVTNVVSGVKKRLGFNLSTHLLVRRTDDPDGKIVIEIRRLRAGG